VAAAVRRKQRCPPPRPSCPTQRPPRPRRGRQRLRTDIPGCRLPFANAGTAGGTLPGAAAAGEIDLPTRLRAAQATAGGTNNDCTAIRPFYWETGDGVGANAGGSVGRTSAGRAIRANTPMRYASASKWLYAAYVAQRRDGALQTWDERMLSMRSGYTHFTGCLADQSIDACLAWGRNDQYEAATDGRFFYSGGHMQKHASLMGLGVLDAPPWPPNCAPDSVRNWTSACCRPRPPAAHRHPGHLRPFLRKMITGELALGGLLGSHAVCASTTGCKPRRCAGGAVADAARPGTTASVTGSRTTRSSAMVPSAVQVRSASTPGSTRSPPLRHRGARCRCAPRRTRRLPTAQRRPAAGD
jgi:hypothetical protein